MSAGRNTRRFPVAGHAASVLECYAEEVPGWRGEPEIRPAVAAYFAGGPYLTSEAPRCLIVAKADALDVADALCELANGEDDMADANSRTNPELAAMNRAGRRGLSTLRSRVLAWSQS